MKKLLLALLMVAFAVPAFAFDIALPGDNNKLNVYGQVRMYALYQNINNGGKVLGGIQNGNDLMYGIQGNSRFGVKLDIGKFFFTAETNFTGDGGDSNGQFGFRLLFGGWKFDHGGTLTIGRQFTTAETMLAYDSIYDGDAGMSGFGALNATRQAMIKYSIAGFEIALGDMSANYGRYGNITDQVGSKFLGVSDKWLPMLELAYNISSKYVDGKVFASYTAVDAVVVPSGTNPPPSATTLAAAGQHEVIHATVVGAQLKIKVEKLTIIPSAFYALNGSLLGKVKEPIVSGGTTNATGYMLPTGRFSTKDGKTTWQGLNDISTVGVTLALKYKFDDMFGLEIGGGYQTSTGSSFRNNDNKVTSLQSFAGYVSAPIWVVKYIAIIPTVGYFAQYDGTAAKKTVDGTLIAGAAFRVIF